MRVQEIMTSDPACCTRDTRLDQVARLMTDHDCGGIPVVMSASDPIPVGVVTDRDIVVRALAHGRSPLEMTAGQVMTSPVVTVPRDASVEECSDLLERNRVRRAPVVDEQGRCCGIVAQADLARHAPEDLAMDMLRKVSEPGERGGTRG
jgi:CBS domain-containing protein